MRHLTAVMAIGNGSGSSADVGFMDVLRFGSD